MNVGRPAFQKLSNCFVADLRQHGLEGRVILVACNSQVVGRCNT